ncbi:MAG: Response regulator PleD [bacterium ADurb.Bin363]|nr:MAG: Response regulator PleD [bacterium ADurb.Bin363]
MSNFLVFLGNKSELVSGDQVAFLYAQEEYFLNTLVFLFKAAFFSEEKCFFLGDKSFIQKIAEKIDLIKTEQPNTDDTDITKEEKKFSADDISIIENFHFIEADNSKELFLKLQDCIDNIDKNSFKRARVVAQIEWLFDLNKGSHGILAYQKERSDFLEKNPGKCTIIDCYKCIYFSGVDMIKLFNYYDGLFIENAPAISYFTNFKELALKDMLTGLYNERYLQERIHEEIFRAKRYRSSCSLIIIKIQDIDEVRYKFGHEKVNQIFVEFSDLLRSSLRKVDLIAIYKKDYFGILMPETSKKRSLMIGERIQKVFEQQFLSSEKFSNFKICLKIGISNFPMDTRHAEELTILADEALRDAMKEEGHKICLAHRDTDWFPPLD